MHPTQLVADTVTIASTRRKVKQPGRVSMVHAVRAWDEPFPLPSEAVEIPIGISGHCACIFRRIFLHLLNGEAALQHAGLKGPFPHYSYCPSTVRIFIHISHCFFRTLGPSKARERLGIESSRLSGFRRCRHCQTAQTLPSVMLYLSVSPGGHMTGRRAAVDGRHCPQ